MAISIKLICEIDITLSCCVPQKKIYNLQTLINITNSKSFLSRFMIHNMFSSVELCYING